MNSDDRGTVIPLITGFAAIAILLVMGVTAASVAFLAQRDLASACDGAAIAAAQEIDPRRVYVEGLQADDDLELLLADAREAAGSYLAADPDPPTLTGVVLLPAGEGVTVGCSSVVQLPFGRVYGYPDGLPRTAAASATSPVLP